MSVFQFCFGVDGLFSFTTQREFPLFSTDTLSHSYYNELLSFSRQQPLLFALIIQHKFPFPYAVHKMNRIVYNGAAVLTGHTYPPGWKVHPDRTLRMNLPRVILSCVNEGWSYPRYVGPTVITQDELTLGKSIQGVTRSWYTRHKN